MINIGLKILNIEKRGGGNSYIKRKERYVHVRTLIMVCVCVRMGRNVDIPLHSYN